ncbi:MAG: creatininase family protein, partial [Planctomycetota bacterium]
RQTTGERSIESCSSDPPHMHVFAKLTWPEAKALFESDPLALVPVGATEAHGPHLPLDTDVTIAVAQARRAAEMLAEAGAKPMVLPPVAYSVAQFAFGFPGTITVRPSTLWNLVEDIVESLEQHGVRRVVLCNSHLELQHVKLLRGVVTDHAEKTERHAQLLFPDITRRRWASTLGEEFLSGECHAGRYETSIVLASDADHVREEARAALAPKAVGLVEKMLGGAKDFLEIGADEAWCGDPASATADEGRRLVDQLAHITCETIREEWPDLFA